ncbi:MAG: DUF6632 domain-containing protein [Terriglobales bacterium]
MDKKAGRMDKCPQEYRRIVATWAVHATLGVFLLIASRNPLAHLSFIWFTVWSSVVHAAIMAVQTLENPVQIGHLRGDVPALLIVAAILALLTPRGTAATVTGSR